MASRVAALTHLHPEYCGRGDAVSVIGADEGSGPALVMEKSFPCSG